MNCEKCGENVPDNLRLCPDCESPDHAPASSSFAGATGSADEIADRLTRMLMAEMHYKSDCFDYLCWLEETHQSENVKGVKFLVLASDGLTCWGNTYSDAVKVAMHHDKELYDAVKNLELPEPEQPNTKMSGGENH